MFKKPGNQKKKGKSKAEKDHLNLVASFPCMVCDVWPVEVHHIRQSGEPRDHFRTIPLCYLHHRGREGVHDGLGKKEFWRRFGHELEMLKKFTELIK